MRLVSSTRPSVTRRELRTTTKYFRVVPVDLVPNPIITIKGLGAVITIVKVHLDTLPHVFA